MLVTRNRTIEPFVMLVTVIQWLFLASLVGLVVGAGTAIFLKALFYSIDQTAESPRFLQQGLLILGGFANGLLLYYGYKIKPSHLKDSSITAVHKQNGRMPMRTFLIKPVAALITLASGGSAGKEGPCAHIGGSLASLLGRLLRLNGELQKRLVACGVSAGFAGVFGTPLAGAIYGVEVLAIGRIRHDFLLPAVISGAVSYQACVYFGIPYQYYKIPVISEFSNSTFVRMILIGVVCGLIARLFVDLYWDIKKLSQVIRERLNLWPPLMPLFGGIILAIFLFFLPIDYYGLSLPIMDEALAGAKIPLLAFFWKSLLVAITLGSGYYAGIVTPQFVIGAVGGNALAHFFGFNPALGAAVGLVSVVAAASNTPIAAIFMGIELFGTDIGVRYIAGATMAAYLIVGHRSVYPDQLVVYTKSSWLIGEADKTLEEEKLHLSYGFLRWLRFLRLRHYIRKRKD